MSGVVIDRLTKRYGARVAVDALKLEARPGEIVGLLGFNGAGKSTTMDMLATLTPPTSGRASVAGHDIAADPLGARAALAIVFESALAARPHWTVAEYLRFFQALRGLPMPPRDLLDRLELTPLLDQTTGTLSAGQRKRTEIARAMAARPDVLLLDEPTKEVDMRGKRVVWEAVRAEARRGAAVMISTHDVLEVRELCDRVAIMHEGRLRATLEASAVRGADLAQLETTLVARMEGR